MRPAELRARIDAGTAPAVLDVRSRAEFDDGHVPGAANVPFWRLLISWPRVPGARDEPLVVYCGHGPRAAMAMAALRRRGYRRVEALDGHMAAWRAAGLPEQPRRGGT